MVICLKESGTQCLLFDGEKMVPCWIIAGRRTGSCFLTSLLNNTNLFDPTFEDYFVYCRRRNEPYKLMPYNKFHPAYWKEQGLNLNETIDAINQVKSCFPDIKFVRLKRNFIDTTVSDYIQRETKMFKVYESETEIVETYLKTKIRVSEDKLKELVSWNMELYILESNICKELGDYLEIEYNDLIKDPKNELNKILKFIGYNDTQEAKTELRKTPERPEYYIIKEILLRDMIKVI